MIPAFIIKIIILGVILIVFINILLYKLIVIFAVKKYISPYFKSIDQQLISTKFVGLFNMGDFGKERIGIKPISTFGNIFNNTFVYVDVIDQYGNTFNYTARILTFFLFIRKVTLKSRNNKDEIHLPCN